MTNSPDPLNGNRYDSRDIVRRGFIMLAGGIKFAAYRVRDMKAVNQDPKIERFGKRQFHMTYVPVTELGFIDRLGRKAEAGDEDAIKHEAINEARATVLAIMDEDTAFSFAPFRQRASEQFAMMPADEPFYMDSSPFNHSRFEAYRTPDGKLEFQVHAGGICCALLDDGSAKLFCTLVRSAVDGPTEIIREGVSRFPRSSQPPVDVRDFVALHTDELLGGKSSQA